MRTLQLTIFLFFILSCTSTSTIQKHGDCFVTYLNKKNQKNDTLTIKILKTVVFDTTANLIHGILLDYNTSKPISGANIELFSFDLKYTTISNSNGEFEIFQNLREGPWNINISQPSYSCLYIVNAVQSGGEWLEIKLRSK